MDWATRRVLSWQLSRTLEADFCVEVLQEAIERYGCPSIFNTDQGSQFTSAIWIDELKANSIGISMDGKGLDGQYLYRAAVAFMSLRGLYVYPSPIFLVLKSRDWSGSVRTSVFSASELREIPHGIERLRVRQWLRGKG